MELSDHELREQLLSKGYNPPPVTDTSRQLLLKKLKKLEADTNNISINNSQNTDPNEIKYRKRNQDLSPEKNDVLMGFNDSGTRQMRSSRKDTDKIDSSVKKNKNSLPHIDSSFNRNDPFEKNSDSDDSISYTRHNSHASLLTRKPLNFKRESEYFSSPSYKKIDMNNGTPLFLNRNFNRGRYSNKNRNFYNRLTSFFLSPRFVLIGSFVFFLFLVGIYYFKDDRSYGELSLINGFDKCKCSNRNRKNCIPDLEIDEILKYLKTLYNILWKNEWNAICGRHSIVKTVMFENEVIEFLVNEFGLLRYECENIVKYMQILIKANPQFKIIWSDVDKSFRLENPDLPWRCPLKKWFSVLYDYVYYLLTAIPLILSMHFLYRRMMLSMHERKKGTDDLVKGILDILQQNAMANPSQNYLPIVHVRDQLISYSDRERKKKMWNKAVKEVEENESRIRKEVQPFQGEDYVVWRWIGGQLSPPKPKTWQGEAFETSKDTRNTPTTSPTPCLKIRHMFNPKNETANEDWGTGVKDAILERCEGINIVHMMVDETSPEGCVYIKCASAEDAGKAYRKIHGAWFDGNIVTVKYLRLERYHERFPASIGLTKSLIPSNDQKRSLA
ncbi:hypothetical protein PGB90_010145 [Kerria lacca]